jgi:hypothetical protein
MTATPPSVPSSSWAAGGFSPRTWEPSSLRWTHTSFTVEDKGVNFAGTPIKLKASSSVDIPLALVWLSWHSK